MVAYSFQSQFIEPILSGRKRGTIRAHGKRRHATDGDALQLYTAMRTRSCRLIAMSQCTSVQAIQITFTAKRQYDDVRVGDRRIVGYALDDFADRDGFCGWVALREFWQQHHPGVRRFNGLWIRWGDITGGMLLA